MPPYLVIFSLLKHNESHGGRRFAITLGTSAEMEKIYRSHVFSKWHILWPAATALTPVLHDSRTYLQPGGKHQGNIKVVETVCRYRDRADNPTRVVARSAIATTICVFRKLPMAKVESLRIFWRDGLVEASYVFMNNGCALAGRHPRRVAGVCLVGLDAFPSVC